MKMFGFKIVRSRYIENLKKSLDRETRFSEDMVDENRKALAKSRELADKYRDLEARVESISKSIESKDSHIVKMGNELSKARELYDESVKEKEALKRAYMDLERKYNLSAKMLEKARMKYDELKRQADYMYDRIQYLERDSVPSVLDEVETRGEEEDGMEPGHAVIPEVDTDGAGDAGMEETVDTKEAVDTKEDPHADAVNAIVPESKEEEKRRSKKRKKSKKNE